MSRLLCRRFSSAVAALSLALLSQACSHAPVRSFDAIENVAQGRVEAWIDGEAVGNLQALSRKLTAAASSIGAW